MSQKSIKPVVLIILDGWGVAPAGEGNAIALARTPNFKKYIADYPAMTLRASGDEVGLSWGEMGNSEVGHLTIGAGRVFYQTLPRINRAIEDGSFFTNPAFLDAMARVKKNNSTLHLLGMVSPGRVHSMDSHLFALLDLAKDQKVPRVAIHAILDGRDTVYNSSVDFIKQLEEKCHASKLGQIATLAGRFYAMDRDHRWDRTRQAYLAIALGESASRATNPLQAIRASYAKEVFDEEFVPTVIERDGAPLTTVLPGDTVIFFNFRADRARQLTHAFVDPHFDKFRRERIPDLMFVTMTEYEPGLAVAIAFPPEAITMPLARMLSDARRTQLHIAETEKYAHVTHFLNGTREEPFAREDRVIVPSPPVAAYDTVPEMSAMDITKRVVKAIDGNRYDFVVVNFANPDMVAHTGNFEATVQAIETVDGCLGKIVDATLLKDGVVVITADHGNAEEMKNFQTNAMDKEHSTNPVPCIIIGKQFAGQTLPAGEIPNNDLALMPPVGMLADVAPTILKIMGLPQPPEMTGQSLL